MSFSETQREQVGVMSVWDLTAELDIYGHIRDSYRTNEFSNHEPESQTGQCRADSERRAAMLIGPTAVRLSRLEKQGLITVPGGVLHH